MNHWTEHNGEHHSVHELLERLASIGETVMIYPSTGGRPKARRMPSEEIDTHTALAEIYNLKIMGTKEKLGHTLPAIKNRP